MRIAMIVVASTLLLLASCATVTKVAAVDPHARDVGYYRSPAAVPASCSEVTC